MDSLHLLQPPGSYLIMDPTAGIPVPNHAPFPTAAVAIAIVDIIASRYQHGCDQIYAAARMATSRLPHCHTRYVIRLRNPPGPRAHHEYYMAPISHTSYLLFDSHLRHYHRHHPAHLERQFGQTDLPPSATRIKATRLGLSPLLAYVHHRAIDVKSLGS